MGTSGAFSSRPCLGVSTLMRMLTVSTASDDNPQTLACYVRAEAFYRYVLTHRQVYEYVADLILDAGFVGSEFRPSLLGQLRLLDQENKLVFLVDDLQKLSDSKKEEMVQNLSFSSTVFFSVHWRDVDLITNQIKKTHPSVCNVELLELDGPQQESLLSTLSSFLGRGGQFDFLHNRLIELRQDPGGHHDILASPLGILALTISSDSPKTMRTRTVLAVLNEMLDRNGFGPFDVLMKARDITSAGLRNFAGWISQLSHNLQARSNAEQARLAWRVQNDAYSSYESQGFLPLLNSALFQLEWHNEKSGPERSYWFVYRDLAIFFIALCTYGNPRDNSNALYPDCPYTNLRDPQLEAEVHTFWADLKEYLNSTS